MKKFVQEKIKAGNVEIVLSRENRLDVSKKLKYWVVAIDWTD